MQFAQVTTNCSKEKATSIRTVFKKELPKYKSVFLLINSYANQDQFCIFNAKLKATKAYLMLKSRALDRYTMDMNIVDRIQEVLLQLVVCIELFCSNMF